MLNKFTCPANSVPCPVGLPSNPVRRDDAAGYQVALHPVTQSEMWQPPVAEPYAVALAAAGLLCPRYPVLSAAVPGGHGAAAVSDARGRAVADPFDPK